jgi:hypothetical protein
MALTGEAMTNPVIVRWLAKLGSASRASPSAVRAVVKQLGNASRVNAALLPVYQQSMKLLAPPLQITAKSAAETQGQPTAP